MVLTGSCQCGDCRYSIDIVQPQINICHCRDCQKQSGSAFGMSLIITPAQFSLLKGVLKTFEMVVDSGRTKTCAFCPNCGVRIYNATMALMSIKAGTLDDTEALQPSGHYWTKRKQAWVTLPDDIPCYADIPEA